MKPQETKDRFVILRAEGKSYAAIQKELGISKATCSSWEKEFKDAITEKKGENLEQLYKAYNMTREGRIKQLGATLEAIEQALAQADLTQVPPDKLLKLNLEYKQALKEEWLPLQAPERLPDRAEPADFIRILESLLDRIRSGEITEQQARQELAAIQSIIKSYDMLELQKRLEALENILGGRQ